jgi:2-C-methyl-D-erythritol 4-phosphate cytidylyltransferase
MANFSVIILTAAPPNGGNDAGGAFVKIDGRESLLRAVEMFLNRDNIKQIQLVFDSDKIEEGKRKFGGHLSFSGVKVVSGGPKWHDQIAAASEKVSPEATHVVLHDAARSAVPYSDIDELLASAEKHPAVVLTAPLRNALVEIDPGGNPMAYRAASEFAQILTPQAFSKEKFAQIAKSKADLHASELTLLKGSPLNVRISGGEASIVNAMIKMLPKAKTKALSPFEEAQW